MSEATGLSRNTIRGGVRELQGAPHFACGRSTLPGRRGKPRTQEDPKLMEALEALVETTARGDPMSPLRWTCKSIRQLAGELRTGTIDVSPSDGGSTAA